MNNTEMDSSTEYDTSSDTTTQLEKAIAINKQMHKILLLIHEQAEECGWEGSKGYYVIPSKPVEAIKNILAGKPVETNFTVEERITGIELFAEDCMRIYREITSYDNTEINECAKIFFSASNLAEKFAERLRNNGKKIGGDNA